MSGQPLFAQIKLHTYFGGGEVFAAHLAEAATALGGSSVLVVHPKARHWATMQLPDTQLIEATDWAEAVAKLPPKVPVIVHAPPPEEIAHAIMASRPLIGFAHMPLNHFYAASRHTYATCTRVVGVSDYVIQTIRDLGIEPWPEPFYGVASTRRQGEGLGIVSSSEFEWDRRKFRDRLLGLSEPVWSKLRRRAAYHKREGLTLGIVSRLAPIKQFPLLFELLAPQLASSQNIYLEIFGAGGFASVRDLRRALKPLGDRVRLWGHQHDVALAYAGIDVLMTGLPEREALGLNVIEAQACGVPVMAPGAPPFTETVLPEQTGWLYADPRLGGKSNEYPPFAELLEHVITLWQRGELPDPRRAVAHMQKFSRQQFASRLGKLLADID